MDTFLYNKFSSNLDKLKKKLDKIKQKGGLIPYPPPVLNPPGIEPTGTERPYYNLLNFGKEFHHEDITGFPSKYLDSSLKLFSDRINEVEGLIKGMDQSKLPNMSQMTPAAFSEVKNQYLDYINAYKTKIIQESYFELDPDKYPAVFYDTSNITTQQFNDNIKALFNLFINQSKVNSKTTFAESLGQNQTELIKILDKCEEFEKEIDRYIKNIEYFLECDNKGVIKDENIFLNKAAIERKEITEYDYTISINYTGNIDDIFTNPNRFKNFIQTIQSVIQEGKLGELKIPENFNSKEILDVYTNLIKKNNSFNPLDILNILSKKYEKEQGIKNISPSLNTKQDAEADASALGTSISTSTGDLSFVEGTTTGPTLPADVDLSVAAVTTPTPVDLSVVPGPTPAPEQIGGNVYDQLYINNQTSDNLIRIITLVDVVNKRVNDFKEKYNKLILTLKRFDLYKFYLKLLVHNLWDKQEYVVFRYINKGLCQYYYGILEDIVDKFKSIGTIQKEIVNPITNKSETNPIYFGLSYLNRYHYITILKLYNFFKSLLSLKFFDNDMIIDIDALQKSYIISIFYINMKENFMLFNNFKDILDSFKETFQNKVTIYGRINDRKEHDIKEKMFIKDKDNGRYLNVNTYKCKADTVMIPKQVKFNEVFDTSLDTQTISKYMTMSSQITKGKGVVIMTYGYSGTGKTFTLFGTKEKQGILQSTLANIIGVKKIYLRVYELYGKGSFDRDAIIVSNWRTRTDRWMQTKNTRLTSK